LAWGGDLDSTAALDSARTNMRAAGISVHLQRWDAVHLPLASQSMDRIVTNLPWGRQVQVDENLERFYRRVCAEFQRVLTADGQIVLLTSLPELVDSRGHDPPGGDRDQPVWSESIDLKVQRLKAGKI
jgi:23S rRNA G2445 N2-methylase RlmL